MKQEMADQKVTLMSSESNQPQLEVNVKQDAISAADLQIFVKLESDEIELTETELQLPDIYYDCVKMEPSDESVELLERLPASPEANEETDEALDHHQPITNRGNTMMRPQDEDGNVSRHFAIIHTDAKLSHKNPCEKAHECSVCKNKFASKYFLKKHMKVHTSTCRVKPYECSLCEYKTAHKSALKSHSTIHTGEKPFKCSECQRSFRSKFALSNHMIVHTGERPYECSMCNYKAAQKGTLKIHLTMHTGEKSYECLVCEKKFREKSNLNRHMAIHTRKKHECFTCNYKTARWSTLVEHLKIHIGVPF